MGAGPSLPCGEEGDIMQLSFGCCDGRDERVGKSAYQRGDHAAQRQTQVALSSAIIWWETFKVVRLVLAANIQPAPGSHSGGWTQ